MTDVSLLPTTGLVGTGCGWGSAGAAALGAFVGSWFGNGWGGNGFNRGGCGYGEGIAAGASAWGTNLVMDNLNQLQNSVGQVNAGINNLGLNLVQGQCAVQRQIGDAAYGVQNSLCQGFSGVNATVNSTTSQLMNANNQGFAGLNATINATNATTNNYLAQGFAGLNTAVQANGYESRLAVKDLAAQNASCCCEIKNAIAVDGAATRQLIQNNYISELQTKLCDAKSKIATLESNAFTSASNQAQTAQIVGAILPHILRDTTTTTTPAA